jgi:hypothetical protein
MSDDAPIPVEEQQEKDLVAATIRMWTKRIKDAITYFDKDFQRMRENMEFAAGIQWEGQDTIESTKYVANFCNREENQKVANLYAKNPEAIWNRRKRLDYQLWDGSIESKQQAHMIMAQAVQTGPSPAVMQAQALLNDIQHGDSWKQLVGRVGDTLEIAYQYQCDTQMPSFKYQMKQLVRRTGITGVGYVRISYSAEGEHILSSTSTDDSMMMRQKRAKLLQELKDDDELQDDDPRLIQLEQLIESMRNSVEQGDTTNIEERLVFDFPDSTSIIVDPKCKALKGFIGARWIAERKILPLEEVQAYYEVKIDAPGKLVIYAESGVEKTKTDPSKPGKDDPQEKPLVCVFEVFDVITKETFAIVDGWNQWAEEPHPVDPSINRFWPIFALTFNDIECEPGAKVHIYPPSDIELIRHPQKELNRTKEELRKHRKANRPWYATLEGWMTQPDKDAVADHESNQLVLFKGIPPGGTLADAIVPFHSAPIDPTVYNTAPILEDVALTIGSNAQQQQQSQRHVAATPAVIAEQARMQGTSSNVDDLDDLLGEMAQAGGEMMLRKFSLNTVKRIVGIGAAFPEQNREDFLNELFLDVVASSSGRPNKAVDVSNAQQLGPLMLQAGAQPWPLIKYYAKVLDANLDPAEFAPTLPPQQGPMSPQSQKKQTPTTQHPGTVGQQPGGLGMPVATQQGGPMVGQPQ